MELLERHFNRALEIPGGINRLRGLILQLAMHGKLVPQEPEDPSARLLLKDIEAEKEFSIGKDKINKHKIGTIKIDDAPYTLPKKWEWVKIGTIAQHNSGKTLDRGRNTGRLRKYITTSNLYWGYFVLENLRQMPIRDEELDRCSAKKGDLLICEGGEAGRAAVWDSEDEICFQNHIHRIRFWGKIDPYFAYRYFEKLNYTGEINRYRKGMAISSISSKTLDAIYFPLPPLAEQKRIIEKIDQLMVLCDKLEVKWKERGKKQVILHTTAIKRLTSAKDSKEFQSAWSFITKNFTTLYSVPENVQELKKAILELAMRGQLVPQNPKDKPASQLMKDIESEKDRLFKEGENKKIRPRPQIRPEEIPYEIPKSWKWVRLSELVEIINGRAYKKNELLNTGAPILRVGNLFTSIKWYYSDLELEDNKYLQKGDLIYAWSASFGPFIWEGPKVIFHYHIWKLNTYVELPGLKLYLYQFLKEKTDEIKLSGHGISMKHMTKEKMELLLFPLPPLAEQKRIVAKIEELMRLCNSLEEQITESTKKQAAIFNAVLAKM